MLELPYPALKDAAQRKFPTFITASKCRICTCRDNKKGTLISGGHLRNVFSFKESNLNIV